MLLAVYDVLSGQIWCVRTAPLRAMLFLLVLGLGSLTLLRSATWGDPFLLAVDLVATNPNSTRAGSDLTALYFGASHGDVDSPWFAKGLREFERVAALPGASPVPDQGLIVMLAPGGRVIDDALWSRLIEMMQRRPIGSQELMSLTGLLSLVDSGRDIDPRRLAQLCTTLLDRYHQSAALYARCGMHALTKAYDEVLAEKLLLQAVEHSAKDSPRPDNIAQSLADGGYERLAAAVRLKAQQVAQAGAS